MPPESEKYSNDFKENVATDSVKCIYDDLRPKNEPAFLVKIRDMEKAMGFVTPLKWINVISIALAHIVLLTWLIYDLYMGILPKWQTAIYVLFFQQIIGGFGVTAGAHRYWTHRSFEANEPLRWILAMLFWMSGQNSIHAWVRDHRVHHKFTDTSSDPHNVTRGFFFSHIGWLMMIKHPDVIREGNRINLEDINNDPLVQFHKKHFIKLKLLFAFVLPTIVPPLLWGETWEQTILYRLLVVLVFTLHTTGSVNSFAHLYGYRPYDPNINPCENLAVALFANGEGWHNYHHAFPWDYKTSELPYFFNFSTLLLDGFAALGWARNLKKATPQMIQKAKDTKKHRVE